MPPADIAPKLVTCRLCRFWRSSDPVEMDEDYRTGECRRRAPQAALRRRDPEASSPKVGFDAFWPDTYATDGCGEGIRSVPI